MVAGDWGVGKHGEIGKVVQTFSYKMNSFLGSNIKQGDYSW